MRAAATLALAVAASAAARADDNDLSLYLLGHPDPITVCAACDGSDRIAEIGDPSAQVRFARLVASLGLAFVPEERLGRGAVPRGLNT